MKKSTKIWLITASALTVLGLLLFLSVMTVYGWDFKKLNTDKYETAVYEIAEDFDSISINTATSDINFVPSDDADCKVVCHGPSSVKYLSYVKDGTLTVNTEDNRKWYDYINIGFEETEITVYLPNGEYGSLSVDEQTGDISVPGSWKFKDADISVTTGDIDLSASVTERLKINTTTGEINIENTVVGDMELSVTTGNVSVSNVSCTNIKTSGSTGDVTLKNTKANGSISVKRTTGDVLIIDSDVPEITVDTTTGDVSGTLLSGKTFTAKTSTGTVNIPESTSGGQCTVTTTTGDIRINVK